MKLHILTERKWEERTFYQVAWEWEDSMLEYLQKHYSPECSFTYIKSAKTKLFKAIYKILYTRLPLTLKAISKDTATINIYTPYRVWHCNQYLRERFIPIFIDVYDYEAERIHKLTRHLPFYFVTSMDTYHQIKGIHPESRVQFMAQSIADKWVTDEVPQKTIDVIQIGRRSDMLHEFMLRYCAEHPSINYVYSDHKSFISTTQGNIGRRPTREGFMDLLGSATVCLVSTPGVTTHRFGKVDFFTARIYESASRYCRMIGHYSDNEEATLLGIPDICPNVHTYEEFERYMDEALAKGPMQGEEKAKYKTFTLRNTSSVRAQQILDCIKKFLG